MDAFSSTSGRKAHDVRPQQVSSLSALIVEVRSPPAISAISPKWSPGLSVRRSSPPTETVAIPFSITKKPTPWSPSATTVSPAANVRCFIDPAICSSSLCSRSLKSGTRSSRSVGAPAMPAILCEKVRAVKLTVVGCSPAWPNPGGAQSGYLVEGAGRLLLDCGPGVLGRLREREPWPTVDAIALTHFHLDHWGDLVPWVWGSMYGPGHDVVNPELHVPPGGRGLLGELGELLGSRDMFEKSFRISEYREREAFRAAGFEVTPVRVPHYTIESYAFRVEDGATVLAY